MLFIFGAGASYANGFPLQRDLLSFYFKIFKDDRNEKEVYDLLKEFFSEFYNISNPINQDFPPLEHILGVIDVCIKDEIGYSPKYNREKLQDIYNLLIYVVLRLLTYKAKNYDKGIYKKFLKNLNNINKELKNIHFITMNYDYSFDDAFDFLYPKVLVDYGIELVNYGEKLSHPFYWWERPEPEKGTYLLKLHGSLNFKYCPLCQNIELIPWGYYIINIGHQNFESLTLIDAIKHRKAKCPIDGMESKILVVPPTVSKRLGYSPLQQIWNKARKLFLANEVIIIVGYSLPFADFHMWQLLKQAELNSGPKKILIINAPGKNSHEVSNRYKQVFSNVTYLNIGFVKFIENLEETMASAGII